MKRIILFLLSLLIVIGLMPSGAVSAKTTATDAKLNTSVTVKLSNSGDSKMYKFTTAEAGKITIEVATTAQGDNYAITTTLKDADGKVVVDPQTGSAYSMPSYGASAGETFYLIVEPAYRGWDASFKITFGFSTTQNWETENNDTSEKADSIISDTDYYGSISRSSDVDFYKFRVSKAAKAKLTFGPAVVDGQSRSWDVDLYNEKGESLDCFDTGSKNSITLNLKKGLYYIRVAGTTTASDDGTVTNSVGGDYVLSFKKSALSIKKPKVTEVKMYGTESWLYDNYATATVSVKNGGAIDGYTMRISRSSNMKSGTKKKNYDLSAGTGVTGKKIRSGIRMGIYPTYYVQVRGYVKDAFGNRMYGKYSAIKSGSLSAREYNKLK